jgi:hypothetical protein
MKTESGMNKVPQVTSALGDQGRGDQQRNVYRHLRNRRRCIAFLPQSAGRHTEAAQDI